MYHGQQTGSYQDDDGDGTSEAPDEFVVDGDPAEVWVSVALWVQAHGQTCREETGQVRADDPGQISTVGCEKHCSP